MSTKPMFEEGKLLEDARRVGFLSIFSKKRASFVEDEFKRAAGAVKSGRPAHVVRQVRRQLVALYVKDKEDTKITQLGDALRKKRGLALRFASWCFDWQAMQEEREKAPSVHGEAVGDADPSFVSGGERAPTRGQLEALRALGVNEIPKTALEASSLIKKHSE